MPRYQRLHFFPERIIGALDAHQHITILPPIVIAKEKRPLTTQREILTKEATSSSLSILLPLDLPILNKKSVALLYNKELNIATE